MNITRATRTLTIALALALLSIANANDPNLITPSNLARALTMHHPRATLTTCPPNVSAVQYPQPTACYHYYGDPFEWMRIIDEQIQRYADLTLRHSWELMIDNTYISIIRLEHIDFALIVRLQPDQNAHLFVVADFTEALSNY